MSKPFDYLRKETFSDDFWKAFRTPEEKDQDEHCLNCGIQLFDDDDPTPYEAGYCRGCQVTKSSADKLEIICDTFKNIGTFARRFKV
jgi:hypothetical protein